MSEPIVSMETREVLAYWAEQPGRRGEDGAALVALLDMLDDDERLRAAYWRAIESAGLVAEERRTIVEVVPVRPPFAVRRERGAAPVRSVAA